MNGDSIKTISKTGNQQQLFFTFPAWVVLWGMLFVIACTWLLYIPPQLTVYPAQFKVGDIAVKDIVIQHDMTIENREITEINRKKALDKLIPIYEYNHEKAHGARQLVSDWFNTIKEVHKNYIKSGQIAADLPKRLISEYGIELGMKDIESIIKANLFSHIDMHALLEKINNWEEKGIVGSKIAMAKSGDGLINIVTDNGETVQTRVDDLVDLKDVKMQLGAQLRDSHLNANEFELIFPIFMEWVSPNITFSKTLTKAEEEKLLANINPVFVHLKQGKVITRSGDEISAAQLELFRLIYQEEIAKGSKFSNLHLIALTVLLVFLSLLIYFRLNPHCGINQNKVLLVMLITLLTSLLIYRLTIFLLPIVFKNRDLLFNINIDLHLVAFALPFGVGAMLMVFLFNLPVTVVFAFINALFSGIVCDWSVKVIVYVFFGNLAIAFGIEYYQRLKRSPVLKVGFFWLIPINLVILSMFLFSEAVVSWIGFLQYVLVGVFSALATVFIANFLIPLWEYVFKLVTDLRLVEITNLNLPVFREMLEKAPGTYHHSQMVASLAEAAAQDLDISPLLLRAMALYHDIGKIEHPQFFIENHSVYEDPHADLTPLESAKMIISHIFVGIDMSKKLKLPRLVSESIIYHHGTKLVKYFWEKEKQASATQMEEIDDSAFRYPGQKPQRIEHAIIMLADQVEAASKSLTTPQEDEIRSIVETIIRINIEESQFDECDDLTFKAMRIIATSYFNKLSSIYHRRIAYPGFNFQGGADTP